MLIAEPIFFLDIFLKGRAQVPKYSLSDGEGYEIRVPQGRHQNVVKTWMSFKSLITEPSDYIVDTQTDFRHGSMV